ncbi:MAG: hypothetical protein VB859_13310, partial [Planctomycetaceae bacterium]
EYANRAGIPVPADPVADTSSTQTNEVTLDAGSITRSVGDTHLEAVPGTELLLGQGYGTDYALGLIPLERTGGSQTTSNTDSVTVNGAVEVGIQNAIQVAFVPSPTTDAALFIEDTAQRIGDPAPTFTAVSTTFAAAIDQRFVDLYAQLAAYSMNSDAKEAILDEITFLEQSVIQMGVPYEEYVDPADGKTKYLIQEEVAIVRIDVHDLFAQSADIHVAGDYLVGSGRLDAPGDTSITVKNSSPAFLRIHEVEIPDEANGRVMFNDNEIDGDTDAEINADINALNLSGHIATFENVVTGASSPDPQVVIESTFDRADPQWEDTDFADVLKPSVELIGQSYASPSDTTRGDIDNVGGLVQVSNLTGSISTSADINAKTIEIAAGGDVLLSYIEGFRHVGGEPRSLWGGNNDANADSTYNARYNETHNDRDNLPSDDHLSDNGQDASPRPGVDSTVEAKAGNVFIAGRYVNINGTIRSGIERYSIQIDNTASFASRIASLESAFSANSSNRYGNISGYVTTIGGGEKISADWDALENRIWIREAEAAGGFVQINGEILSTSGGVIEVLDGFADIEIDNNTSYPIVVNRLSTATSSEEAGVEGQILIKDSAQAGAARPIGDGETNNSLLTKFTRTGNTVSVLDSATIDADGNPTHVVSSTAGRTASYDVKNGFRYVWRTGHDQVSQKIYTHSTSSFWGIINVGENEWDNVQTIGLTESPILDGEFVETNTGLTSDNYTYSMISPETSSTVVEDRRWSRCTTHFIWCQVTTHYRRKVTKTGFTDYSTHSVAADFPVSVSFIGSDTGNVTINSVGDVLVNQRIRAAAGTVTIAVTDGSIEQSGSSGLIEANTIDLTATENIGESTSVLETDLVSIGSVTGRVDAVSSGVGEIVLTENDADFVVGTISANSGNVTLSAPGSITAATSSSQVSGHRLTLTADNGSVGEAGDLLNLDSGDDDASGVEARGRNGVFLREVAGDMRLVQARATTASS